VALAGLGDELSGQGAAVTRRAGCGLIGASGLASSLMRMAPGAELPEHEPVRIEQTWVLEGHLVDRSGPDEGIECKAGQFTWRPAGSRHSEWSPQGGLMLAFFQIPNKFLEADGRVTDMAGKDWQAVWGTLPGGA
jgi:quercetin dioxygenase-like cupin family protein